LKNLERAAAMLLGATTKPGEPYDELEELYSRLLGQWVREMSHVAAVVGGLDTRQKVFGQDGLRFVPIPRARQQEAARFLNSYAFATPAFMIKPDILRRIEPAGALDRIRASQQAVLATLLADARIARLVEQEAIDGAAAYRPTEFLADVRRGIWSELSASSVAIDPYRRNLQRAYLTVMGDKVNGRLASTGDGRGLARGELRAVDLAAQGAIARAADAMTRTHLRDIRDRIAKILDPQFAPPAAPGPLPLVRAVDDLEGCWLDYAIRRATSTPNSQLPTPNSGSLGVGGWALGVDADSPF
jgi:hypothetical protein